MNSRVGGAGEFRAAVPAGSVREHLSPMDPFILPLLLPAVAYLSLVLANDTNGTAGTAAPATTSSQSRLTESERLAAIIVPSVVGGIILIGILVFIIIKVKEKRQTEGTYRPSSEEQTGSRIPPNSALKLPPEERLI
ncbi:protein crumbs homolog 3 isoform X2 [Lithobates pipiens]